MAAPITPWRRDTISTVEGVPQTFSSWGNCMQKPYCKYPAIIGIVIGSLIVFSIVFCLVRCLCCGMSCCCSCLSCCESCCPSGGRRKRSKYAEGPSAFQSAPHQGYQPAPAPPSYEPPRYAQFDAPSKGGKINDDALPAMPSWDNASSRKVEDMSPHHEDMEMGNLNSTGQTAGAVSSSGRLGRGGYSEVPSIPGTPTTEMPASYRGAETMNPYGSGPTAYGAGPGATVVGAAGGYARTSPTHGPGAGYARTSPGYGQSYGGGSPQNERTPYNGGFNAPQPYRAQPQAPYQAHTQPAQSFTAYAPSGSTRYEPSSQQNGVANTSPTEPTGNRPPSLLQAGRKPVHGSWRDV